MTGRLPVNPPLTPPGRGLDIRTGSATVPVALFGVSPNSRCNLFRSPFGALGRLLPARRRDADGSGRDDRAPHQEARAPREDAKQRLRSICYDR